MAKAGVVEHANMLILTRHTYRHLKVDFQFFNFLNMPTFYFLRQCGFTLLAFQANIQAYVVAVVLSLTDSVGSTDFCSPGFGSAMSTARVSSSCPL